MERTARVAWERWIRDRWWPESGALSPIPALDGLRALAVVLVLLFHSWNDLPGFIQPGQDPYQFPINYGRTGVDLFFVLSGFLLFMPYARWILGTGKRPSTWLFYRRRALRIGPAYWLCLCLLALVGPHTIAALLDVVAHVFFLSNAFPQTTFSINGVFWTMAVEVQFYAVLPLIAGVLHWLSRRMGPRLGISIGLGSVIALSLIETVLTKRGTVGHLPIVSSLFLSQYSSLPFWLDVFACGMAVSVVYVSLLDSSPGHHMPRGLCTTALILGVAVALGVAFVPIAHRLPCKDFIFGGAYTGLLIGILGGPTMVQTLFASRPLRFVGLVSYSFYLWHANIVNALGTVFLQHRVPLGQTIVLNIVLGLPISLLVAYVSYQSIERPFIRARVRAHEPTTKLEHNVPAPEPSLIRN